MTEITRDLDHIFSCRGVEQWLAAFYDNSEDLKYKVSQVPDLVRKYEGGSKKIMQLFDGICTKYSLISHDETAKIIVDYYSMRESQTGLGAETSGFGQADAAVILVKIYQAHAARKIIRVAELIEKHEGFSMYLLRSICRKHKRFGVLWQIDALDLEYEVEEFLYEQTYGQDVFSRVNVRRLMVSIYTTHAPDKIVGLDKILDKFVGAGYYKFLSLISAKYQLCLEDEIRKAHEAVHDNRAPKRMRSNRNNEIDQEENLLITSGDVNERVAELEHQLQRQRERHSQELEQLTREYEKKLADQRRAVEQSHRSLMTKLN